MIMVPAGVIWVLGGNRDWIMMPVIIGVLLVLVLFLYRFLVSPLRYEIEVPPGGWFSLVFLSYLVIQNLFSEIPYDSVLETFKFSSYVIAYWVWFNLLRVNGRWRWTLSLIFISVSMMACFAIIQEVHGTRSVLIGERHPDYAMRASGTYICPNHFANLLVMIILAGTGILLSKKSGSALKLFAGYAILSSLYPLLLSESRSAWIGLVAGLVVLAITSVSGRGVKKLMAVILLAPLIAASVSWVVWKASPRVQTRVAEALAGNMRIPLWQDSVDIALQAPWIGHGLGTYRHIYGHFRNHLKMTEDPVFAHNEYIHFWTELGFVGIVLGGLLVLTIIFRATRRAMQQSANGESAFIPAAITAVMGGSWSHAFFDFNFNLFGNVHVYVFLLAALFAASGSDGRTLKLAVTGQWARVAGIVMILGVLLATAFYINLTASYFHYIKGLAWLDAHDWESAATKFEKSFSLSKNNWRAHLSHADLMRTRAFWMRNPEIRNKWVAESTERYELIHRLNPWEGSVWYGLGILYDIKGDQESSLAMKRKAAEEIPRHTFYLNALGMQLVKMRRDREALEVFLKSIEAEPTTVASKNIEMINRRLGAP